MLWSFLQRASGPCRPYAAEYHAATCVSGVGALARKAKAGGGGRNNSLIRFCKSLASGFAFGRAEQYSRGTRPTCLDHSASLAVSSIAIGAVALQCADVE